MNKIWATMFLAFLVFSAFGNYASAENTGMGTVIAGTALATSNSTQNGTVTWQAFWSNLYTWVIITPAAFLMALPWLLYVFNRVKAEHEEDPQAQYKAKRWFTLAIEVDIVLALVVSGVLFAWFHALANP